MSFVEFAGKKEYKCRRCNAPIMYAKFIGTDGKLLTVDGKEPFSGKDETGKFKSNTGFPCNPLTKTMHECNIKIQESQTKQTDLVDTSIGLKDIDKKIRDRIINDSYLQAKFLIWKLEGVEKACKEVGIDLGAKSGMIFNQVCEEERRKVAE